MDVALGENAPLVTVIVATYNRSATLRLTIDSLLEQDFPHFEAWVVGDACTDDSAEVVRSFNDDRLHWANLGRNSGSQARPNNVGLQLARGRYVAYLGHDDLWLPWHLSGLVGAIQEQGADFVHSLCALIGPTGVRECVGPPRPGVTYARHFVPPSCWLHRRDLTAACGLWRDPDRLPYPVDQDYSRRAFLAGKAFAFLPRLTTLKFPSQWFPRAYANVGPPPQRPYWQALKEAPAELERRVLLELAVAFARDRRGGDEPVAAALHRVWRLVLRAIPDHIGRERWPLSLYMRRRVRQQRRASRPRRGLPPRHA